MKILGLDIGEKRIGIAISDGLGITAQGLKTVKRSSADKDRKEIEEIIKEYKCTKLIVGYPRRTDGTLGPETNKITSFIEALKESVKLPVVFWDERFTTIMAERTLIEADISRTKRRKVIDKMAAVLILQNYLDSVAHA